jgi:hypothetical protein
MNVQNIIIIIIIIPISIIIICLLYIFKVKKWKCIEGKCELVLGGDYSSIEKCQKSGCVIKKS